MELKKEQLVEIYKKFNSLFKFTSDPIQFNKTSFDFIEILIDRYEKYNNEQKLDAFTSYMAIELFNFYRGNKNYLDDLYTNKNEKLDFSGGILKQEAIEKDDDESELDLSGQIDASSVMQLVNNEYYPTEQQIETLKSFVLESPEKVNKIKTINENGKYVNLKKPSNYSEKELKVENKYQIQISKIDGMNLYKTTYISEYWDKFDNIFDKYGSFFSKEAISDKDYPTNFDNTTYRDVINNINKDIRENNGAHSLNGNIQIKHDIESDLGKDINMYFGLKKSIERKEGTIGRYLNPFNWKRTYQTNKGMRELKKRISDKYGLNSSDWKYIESFENPKITNDEAKKKLDNNKNMVFVNLIDDQKYIDKFQKEVREQINLESEKQFVEDKVITSYEDLCKEAAKLEQNLDDSIEIDVNEETKNINFLD